MKRLLLILLSSTCLSAPAMAQGLAAGEARITPGGVQAGDAAAPAGSTAELVQKVRIMTVPKAAVEVPENEPVAVDMSLTEVPGADPKLLAGVTGKAFTRYVKVDGEPVGQLVLTAVAKKEKVEPLPHELFATQFNLDGEPVLAAARPVVIEGDKAALIAALQRLQAADGEQEEEEEAEKERKDDGSDGRGKAGAAAGPAASSYKPPGPVEVAEEDKDEPKEEEGLPTIEVSSANCPIRVDVAQGVAIQQSQVITTNPDGSVSEEACGDGAERYPLQRTSVGCADTVDLEARTATANYALYYVDAKGNRVEAQGCQPDPEQVFPIVEQTGTCPVWIDYDAMTAVRQTSLVYQNAANATVTVRGCEPSETATPAPMTQTTEGCSIRHDFAGGKSIRRAKYIYTMDGVTYQAGDCTDTEVEYPHQRIYETAAGPVCTPVINKDNGTVTQASRVQITVDGVNQFITECQPDTSPTGLVATTEGCSNPALWTHDLAAGQSYGQERFYYTRKDGRREYVTDCQDSAATYAHQLEIGGWQNHDAELFAYRLSTIYIDTPAGRYDVVKDTVLTGTEQMPYVLDRTATLPTGHVAYEGCDAYSELMTLAYYLRPDGTEYTMTTGTEAADAANACVTEVIETREIMSGLYTEIWNEYDANDPTKNTYRYGYLYGMVDKVRTSNPHTEEVFATDCRWNGPAAARKVMAGDSNYWTTVAFLNSNSGGQCGFQKETTCVFVNPSPCPF